MRTEPIDTGLIRTCSGGGFTFRKRMDGGYTVTDNHFSVADIVPDSFRLFREFLPPAMASNLGPAVASILIYVLMAGVLFWKPQGLFPARG